jgi:hypothetical protein
MKLRGENTMTKPKKGEGIIKKMTLRQQLRAQAEEKLETVQKLVLTGVQRALEEADVELNKFDVMRLCIGGQTKTVHEQLVTDLANQAEAKLLEIWNNQQQLPLGESNGD